jgi:hypothetical protein
LDTNKIEDITNRSADPTEKIGNMADKNDGSRIVNVESIYLVDSKRSCMKFRPCEHVNSQLPLSSKGVSQRGLHVKHGPCGLQH